MLSPSVTTGGYARWEAGMAGEPRSFVVIWILMPLAIENTAVFDQEFQAAWNIGVSQG